MLQRGSAPQAHDIGLHAVYVRPVLWLSRTDPNNPSSSGSDFVVGFMQNIIPRDPTATVPDAYLLVSTEESEVVNFQVSSTFSGTSSYQVSSSAPTRVNFPADDAYVTSIQDRNKAIRVQALNNKKITIHAINDEFRSSDGFLVLPCDGMRVPSDFRSYEYLILSTRQDVTQQAGSTARSTQFLIITCEDNTVVTVTPTTTVSGSGVFQHPSFGPGTAQASSTWRQGTTTPAQQTLLIAATGQDYTGTLIKGNKPLVVISGHQCGQVTDRVTACDHMSTQIPPHTTWGYTFLLNPLSGRQSGDLYRFATLLDNTDITITCVDAGGTTATADYTRTLSSTVGSNHGQFETHTASCTDPYVPKYCCLESSKPIVVAQYSYGYSRDSTCNGEISDPFMTLIPPMIQYLRVYHLLPVNVTSGNLQRHFYSVTVPVRYFQSGRIMLDDNVLEPDATLWQPIYCSGGLCGYGITKTFDDEYHRLYHADANAAIFVHTYGFNIQNSYALAGGMELQPISGKYISLHFSCINSNVYTLFPI